MLFSEKAVLLRKFSDFSSKEDFNKMVANLPLLDGTTRIDRALDVAYKEMFNVNNGMRPGVAKVLILLTDGKQTDAPNAVKPSIAVLPLHNQKIKVISIGIGLAVDPVELESIVLRTDDLYLAKDFNELKTKTFVRNIADASCEAPGMNCHVWLTSG